MPTEMTMRDHFAAAALTGLLARGLLQSNLLATDAYTVADAMLRCRGGGDCPLPDNVHCTANLDAAPAARASVESVAPQPTTGDGAGNPPSHSGTGDTPKPQTTPGEGSLPREGTEPVAWAVAGDYGDYAVALFTDKASAQTEADRRALVGLRPGYVVVPLYRSPTLTDAEREAVERAADWLDRWQQTHGYHSAESGDLDTLRGLLERLGGGK